MSALQKQTNSPSAGWAGQMKFSTIWQMLTLLICINRSRHNKNKPTKKKKKETKNRQVNPQRGPTRIIENCWRMQHFFGGETTLEGVVLARPDDDQLTESCGSWRLTFTERLASPRLDSTVIPSEGCQTRAHDPAICVSGCICVWRL